MYILIFLKERFSYKKIVYLISEKCLMYEFIIKNIKYKGAKMV